MTCNVFYCDERVLCNSNPHCCVLYRSKQLIRNAINVNDFLKNLEPAQVREIVDCMYSKVYSRGETVITEGEPGDALYVIAGKKVTWGHIIKCVCIRYVVA